MGDYKPATILCSAYYDSVRRLIGGMLAGRGYNVIEVGHAKEAIPHVPSADLVVTDVSNGGKDLYDCVRDQRPGVKVIFIVGIDHFPEGTPEGSIVLQKPFHPAELEALVRDNLPEHLKPHDAA